MDILGIFFLILDNLKFVQEMSAKMEPEINQINNIHLVDLSLSLSLSLFLSLSLSFSLSLSLSPPSFFANTNKFEWNCTNKRRRIHYKIKVKYIQDCEVDTKGLK